MPQRQIYPRSFDTVRYLSQGTPLPALSHHPRQKQRNWSRLRAQKRRKRSEPICFGHHNRQVLCRRQVRELYFAYMSIDSRKNWEAGKAFYLSSKPQSTTQGRTRTCPRALLHRLMIVKSTVPYSCRNATMG